MKKSPFENGKNSGSRKINADEAETPDNSEVSADESTPYEYEDIYDELLRARNVGAAEFQNALGSLDKDGRIKNDKAKGKVKLRVIEVEEESKITPKEALKYNGFDENFATRSNKIKEGQQIGEWQQHDESFNLQEEPVNFTRLFQQSRLPTNSYIHFREDKERTETTGHSGGFFRPPEYSPSPEKLRSDSIRKIRSFSGNAGSKHAGSIGKSGFDAQRKGVIDNVINEAFYSKDPRVKKVVAARAHIEALKFVVNNTVSYRDNNESNLHKFKGLTTNGLNLEDPISQEYAFKHYQSVRDALKMVIVAEEQRLNGDYSLYKNPEVKIAKLQRVVRGLEATVLEEKYHRGNYKRSLSPLRYSSPYSRANVDITLDKLEAVRNFEDITGIYSSPIPPIKLSEKLAQSEERRPKTEPRKKRAEPQKVAATFPMKAERKAEVLPPPPTDKFSYADLHGAMNPEAEENILTQNHKILAPDRASIARVRNYDSFYADDEINLIMDRQLPLNTAYISPAISLVPEAFNQAIVNFIQSSSQNQAVIVIADQNHFTGIHIARDIHTGFSIRYFDPSVDADYHRPLHDLPVHIAASLYENFPNVEIRATRNIIQTSRSENDVMIIENNHCGAFVTHFMTEMARGNIRVDAGIIQEREGAHWRDIKDLTSLESDQLGQKIRNYHGQFLESKGAMREENPIKISRILQNNSQQKKELSEILRARAEEIKNDKPSSDTKISDITTLKTSSLEHKK